MAKGILIDISSLIDFLILTKAFWLIKLCFLHGWAKIKSYTIPNHLLLFLSPVLLFVLLRKCEIVYHKQFKRQIRNALHIQKNAAPTMCLNSNFMISFCLDNKMSLFQATKTNSNTRHIFTVHGNLQPRKCSISRQYIKTHRQFPKPSPLASFNLYKLLRHPSEWQITKNNF